MPHLEEVKALALLPFSSYDRNKFEFPKEHYSKKCSYALTLPISLKHYLVRCKTFKNWSWTFIDTPNEVYFSISTELNTVVGSVCFHFNTGTSQKTLTIKIKKKSNN